MFLIITELMTQHFPN